MNSLKCPILRCQVSISNLGLLTYQARPLSRCSLPFMDRQIILYVGLSDYIYSNHRLILLYHRMGLLLWLMHFWSSSIFVQHLLSVIFHVKEMFTSALEVKSYTKRQNPSHKRSLTRKERDKRCWTNLKGNKKHMSQNNNLIWYVCSFVYWLWLHGLLEKVLQKPSCMLVWLGIKHILLQTNKWI